MQRPVVLIAKMCMSAKASTGRYQSMLHLPTDGRLGYLSRITSFQIARVAIEIRLRWQAEEPILLIDGLQEVNTNEPRLSVVLSFRNLHFRQWPEVKVREIFQAVVRLTLKNVARSL